MSLPEIMRLEIFFYLCAIFAPALGFLVFMCWYTERNKPMATYTKPRAERRPETMTMDEEFKETCRRG